jgi:hypothetical protein
LDVLAPRGDDFVMRLDQRCKGTAYVATGKGGGCPPPCVRLLYILNLRISEDPQTAVTVAAEDVREPVFSNERLHAPEVVAERVEVAAHFNELARGVPFPRHPS